MAELVDAADSKSVFERSGSSSLPRGTILKKDLEIQGLFFRLQESHPIHLWRGDLSPLGREAAPTTKPVARKNLWLVGTCG